MRKLSFEQAKRQFVHRFTAEHMPQWAAIPLGNGRYYAPHYLTDREWYDKTLFYGESKSVRNRNECYSSRESWPFGRSLSQCFTRNIKGGGL